MKQMNKDEYIKTASDVMYTSMLEELEKIAAPRWKQLLRSGDLPQDSVNQLVESGVLDYGREIAGLNRGSDILAQRHGMRIFEGSPIGVAQRTSDIVDSLSKGEIGKALKQIPGVASETVGSMGVSGGGGVAFPGGIIALSPDANVISETLGDAAGKLDRDAISAIVKRHEVNEQLAKAKQRAAKKRSDWAVHREPEGTEKMFLPGAELQREELGQYQQIAEALRSTAEKAPLIGKWLKKGPELALDRIQYAQRMLPPKGKTPAGVHYSPEVIMRESSDIATMPAGAQRAFRDIRAPAEMEMMGNAFQYGTAPTSNVRKAIMRKFEKGEL